MGALCEKCKRKKPAPADPNASNADPEKGRSKPPAPGSKKKDSDGKKDELKVDASLPKPIDTKDIKLIKPGADANVANVANAANAVVNPADETVDKKAQPPL